MLRAGASGIVNFNLGNSSWNELDTPENTVTTNVWYHLAAVYDGNYMKIFVDGQEVASQAVPNIGFSSPNQNLMIGSWSTVGRFLNGSIEEVRVWNVARSQVQLQDNRNCELDNPTSQTGLVAYYKFNQGNGGQDNTAITSLTDATANANNGTLNNFTKTGTTSNFLAGSPIVTGTNCAVLSNESFEVANNIKIYPNPSNGIFAIETQEDSTVEVFDMIGKKVYSNKLSVGSSTIDLSNYTNGIYLLTVTNQKGNSNSFKLIKQ